MYLLCLFLLPLPAVAAPLSQDVTVFKSWFVTCLAVLLIGAVVFLLARRKLRAPWRNGGAMRVQSVLSLGMKEKLVLVHVDDQRFLLGVTQQQISLISHLPQGSHQETTGDFTPLFRTTSTGGSSTEDEK